MNYLQIKLLYQVNHKFKLLMGLYHELEEFFFNNKDIISNKSNIIINKKRKYYHNLMKQTLH